MIFAIYTLLTVAMVSLVATAVVLVRCFRRSRNRGALVLAFALVGLPLIFVIPSSYVRVQVDHVRAGEVAGWPFSLVAEEKVSAGQLLQLFRSTRRALIAGCTLLGVFLLTRTHASDLPLPHEERGGDSGGDGEESLLVRS